MPKQLLAEEYQPLLIQPGRVQKQDYEYERQPTANIFILFEPPTGKRYIATHTRRKAVDWAQVMKTLSDELYPQAEKIIVVMDNLNTRKLASFYETFEPEKAHRLSQRFEIHYFPRPGSWFNMAEIELSALVRQCLNRRIPDEETLGAESQAWAKQRNDLVVKVGWRFTTADARVKLKRLYPKIQV
jgi:hypothetical protein